MTNLSKKCFRNGAPPDSNRSLSVCQKAPGEAASRAHFSDKKQLFKQQLKHCSRFLQKKVSWIRNVWEKLNGLLKNVAKALFHVVSIAVFVEVWFGKMNR